MRRVTLFAGGAGVVLGLTALALFMVRGSIIEYAVTRAMAGAGLKNPEAEFGSLGLSQLTLTRLRAGGEATAPDLSIEGVRIDFSLGEALSKGRARTVTITDGTARAIVTEDGAFSIAGWRPDPNAKRVAPPFEALLIENMQLVAVTPKGPAEASLAGDFTLSDGGEFSLDFRADRAGFDAAALSDAAGAMILDLTKDGAITVTGGLTSDLETPSGAARFVAAGISARLTSWRGFFGDGPPGLVGSAKATVKSASIAAGEAPSLALLPAAGAAPIRSLSIAGAIDVDFAADGMTAALKDGPIEIAADRGDRLTISGTNEGIVYRTQGQSGVASVRFRLAGPVASGEASLDATRDGAGAWLVKARTGLSEQKIGGVSLAGFEAAFDGSLAGDSAQGVIAYDGLVRAAEIGRMRINDMPAAGQLALAVDMKGRTMTASLPAGECLRVDRATFALPDQDFDARLGLAKFCGGEAPLLAMNWGEPQRVRLAGSLTAATSRFRMGRTDYAGAPPQVRFALDYEPAANTSRVTGNFSGGGGVLTNSLRLSGASGSFDASLIGTAMAASARLQSLMIAQAAKLELVAPVVAGGELRLENDAATFDFDVKTPRGMPLGRGKGRHDVKSGKGAAEFDSGDLTFVTSGAGGGLQPDRLIPALRGIISAATGSAGGKAAFAWTPAGVASSAAVALKDVSFGGPGVAVTRTEGVTGDLVFTSLAPAQTAGEQTLLIRKVDLDALDLENGSMRFELPGDDTLKIVEAEFPWFGGTIGAYGSTMPLSGEKAETKLQIDNVSLGELLAFLNVEGLSGEGTVEGVFPIAFEAGRARINSGILSAKGGGVIRYKGQVAAAAGQTNEATDLTFNALREFRYDALSTTIDGPLDGTLKFKVFFEGRSDVSVKTPRGDQTVDSPFIFRVSIDAPLLSLLDQAAVSLDVRRQIEQALEATPKPDQDPEQKPE
ncbi:MAG: YdbH domain-containing protein [Parvularculaceae bacterium]